MLYEDETYGYVIGEMEKERKDQLALGHQPKNHMLTGTQSKGDSLHPYKKHLKTQIKGGELQQHFNTDQGEITFYELFTTPHIYANKPAPKKIGYGRRH